MTTPQEHTLGSEAAAETKQETRIPRCATPIWQGATRKPAVAGTFYPADPDALRQLIDWQLARAHHARASSHTS